MTFVVSLAGFTPGPRYNNTPWTQGRIEESSTQTGMFVPIEVIELDPLDTDPENPVARNFTTSLATLEFGWYRVVFIDAFGGEQASDAVEWQPVSVTTLTYAQVSDLRSYVPVTLPETNEQLTTLLRRCEVEIDEVIPRLYPDDEPGVKIVPGDETNLLLEGLRDATCAQAEYHLHMGEAFFVEAYGASEGPDTSSKRKAPRISPKSMTELRRVGLVTMTGTMTQVGGVQPTAGFSVSNPRRTV